MLSIEQLDTLINELTDKKDQLIQEKQRLQEEQRQKEEDLQKCFCNLAASEVLILIGLISGVLEARFFSLSFRQIVTVTLRGSLVSDRCIEEGSGQTSLSNNLSSIDSDRFNIALKSLIERLKNLSAEEFKSMVKELAENPEIKEEPQGDCVEFKTSTLVIIIGILTGSLIATSIRFTAFIQEINIIVSGSLGEAGIGEDIETLL